MNREIWQAGLETRTLAIEWEDTEDGGQEAAWSNVFKQVNVMSKHSYDHSHCWV